MWRESWARSSPNRETILSTPDKADAEVRSAPGEEPARPATDNLRVPGILVALRKESTCTECKSGLWGGERKDQGVETQPLKRTCGVILGGGGLLSQGSPRGLHLPTLTAVTSKAADPSGIEFLTSGILAA